MVHAHLATTYRGGRLEGIHTGSVCVVDLNGSVIYSKGDPQFSTYMRSSVKMLQAVPVVESGAADRFGFGDAELSVCCASHTGAGYHLHTVRGMLGKIGLDEANLECGAHEPSDKTERDKAIRGDIPFTPVYNNCSGKHTGMLSVCLASGWDLRGYVAPEHPLQRRIADIVSEYTGVSPDAIGTAVDGCSLPTFYLPLNKAALALARFTHHALNGGADESPARIFSAVNARPEMVHEQGGFDTELMRAMGGRCIAKRGAMAMYLAGLNTAQHGPVGLAVKLDDGDSAAMSPVVMGVLERLGLIDDEALHSMEAHRAIQLTNWNGINVGQIVAEQEK